MHSLPKGRPFARTFSFASQARFWTVADRRLRRIYTSWQQEHPQKTCQ
jgi:hypothetical protein